jgi:lysyl-tRNA synthetase class II
VNESNHPLFDPANLTDQEVARLRNLAGLKELGIEPYPARVKRSHTIAQARALHESGASAAPVVSVTGRIRRLRIMGKMSFADLEDGTGSIQIVARRAHRAWLVQMFEVARSRRMCCSRVDRVRTKPRFPSTSTVWPTSRPAILRTSFSRQAK